ncbi:hypothetical protein EDB81DRAFT_7083 [Dactylonectria macrodidyma]|uniref:EGF-like domain-containing protein n=1 Tax=Dactylonectria macrodidyma TaxID=307937 RepID=A0A9P9FQW4_9HYPO|nr:hypothetical protein EDB81DRAFT_7083 [Dactylonectria macrodidyma]
MSQPYYERAMDRPEAASGSIKRARERAQAGLPRSTPPPMYQRDMNDDAPPGDLRAPPRRPSIPHPAGQSRIPRIRAPGMDGRNANGGPTISRPTQVPQWPLAGPPLAAMNQPEPEPYRPPPGRPQQAPQRPPRPSQVPSMLDQSRLQEPTPVFLNPDADYYSESPTSPSSDTSSTMGELHDFPPAGTHSLSSARRSANLGPPPSSRRGASSFYSNPSYVSPIPEESLASKSHGSYASSAAMPDSWPIGSGDVSPTFYDETDAKSQGSIYDDFGDESKLVRSASIGKRGKPALVTTKSSSSTTDKRVHSPVQAVAMSSNERMDPQNSWIAMTTPNPPAADDSRNLSPDAMLGAYAAASATDLAENRMKSPSPQPPQAQPQFQIQPAYSRMSAIRRPPRLDIDAVRSMEERGSITSLPDLIRRATRLASMIDRGKRPASRFGELNDYVDEKGQARGGDKENSGLSDMLAAFPPPAQVQTDRQSRGSWFRTTSWPLAPGRQDAPSRSQLRNMAPQDEPQRDKRRRCCGLPMWGFILVMILLLCVVAAAIVIPLEFFVFKNLGNGNSATSSELAQCQESLVCQNGGSNVISQGTCSCTCTNGFTGSDCGTSGSEGCTTTDLVSSADDTTISNVTLGKAIPRLIAYSSSNFSIPLSGTSVMAKFNSGDLSCIAQNSLVTFDGSATRRGEASDKVESTDAEQLELDGRDLQERATTTAAATSAITISPDIAATTLVLDEGSAPTTGTETADSSKATSSATATSDSAEATATFTVTEEVLDFARVAVLYVLQEESEDHAETVQTNLQRFFTSADTSSGVTESDASSVDIGNENTIDLVNYSIDIGSGSVGGKTKRGAVPGLALGVGSDQIERFARHGGSVIPSL